MKDQRQEGSGSYKQREHAIPGELRTGTLETNSTAGHAGGRHSSDAKRSGRDCGRRRRCAAPASPDRRIGGVAGISWRAESRSSIRSRSTPKWNLKRRSAECRIDRQADGPVDEEPRLPAGRQALSLVAPRAAGRVRRPLDAPQAGRFSVNPSRPR